MSHRAVHPFPARMAPELVSAVLSGLPANSRVLDPMMGSGTFPIAASLEGHNAFGFDTDPLALTIAKTASGDFDRELLVDSAHEVVRIARASTPRVMEFDPETRTFVDYWFDRDAQCQLTALADAIMGAHASVQAPLWCAFSRLIVTKDAGASRARDVSHSRPHRVRELASFAPVDKYLEAALTITGRLPQRRQTPVERREAHLALGDARQLPLPDDSIDAIVTSPPYLCALDYLRGHRLSLVWMNHSLGELRAIRGANVGTERGGSFPPTVAEGVVLGDLTPRHARIVSKYQADLKGVMRELHRVAVAGASMTIVVADSAVGTSIVQLDKLVTIVAEEVGFRLTKVDTRAIPPDRRYLPPPESSSGYLGSRMRQEAVLSFAG
jgi:DNA modification methylase